MSLMAVRRNVQFQIQSKFSTQLKLVKQIKIDHLMQKFVYFSFHHNMFND